MSKKSIILYEDWAETIKGLPIDIKCEVVDALLTYGFTNELPEAGQIVKAIVSPWCKELDKNNAKYRDRVERMNKINEKHQNDNVTKSSRSRNEVDMKSERNQSEIVSVDEDVDVYVYVDDNVDKDKDVSSTEDIISISSELEAVKDQFNAICISFPKITRLTETRKKLIKTRLKEYSIDEIISVFEKAEASDFLSGRNKQWTGCNFDWLMKPTNIVKVIEGTYDNKGKTSGSAYIDAINNRYSIADRWLAERRAGND